MRYPIIITLLFYSTVFNAQISYSNEVEYDKKIYAYETLNDFKNDNGKYVGDFYGTYGKNELMISEIPNKGKRTVSFMGIGGGGGKPKTINIKKFWGYKIDKYVFRVNKTVPAAIIKIKEKIFYVDGGLYLSMIRYNSNHGVSANSGYYYTGIFYSDSLESKIIDIKKFPKKDSDFSELNKCFKKAKKRYGSQPKFNARLECIEKL